MKDFDRARLLILLHASKRELEAFAEESHECPIQLVCEAAATRFFLEIADAAEKAENLLSTSLGLKDKVITAALTKFDGDALVLSILTKANANLEAIKCLTN